MPIKLQRYIAFFSILLFLVKLLAWYLTNSVTIFTDALESTVNVIAGFIGLYSVILAARPRDLNHPYGHGKVEFVSAAIEGALIFIAGLMIIYEAVGQLLEPKALEKLDIGICLTAGTGVLNFFLGTYAVKVGRKNRSLTVEAAGKHLRTDAYSTFAIVVGLMLLLVTGWQWLDSVVAIIFSFVILVTGYRLIRRSMAGIMDEADTILLDQVVKVMQQHRKPNWIDLHNLRVIQYGDIMHIDAHMTLPWYQQVKDAEQAIHDVEDLVTTTFGNKVEVFIHVDACMYYQCKLCAMPECPVRKEPMKELMVWTVDNVLQDAKHGKGTAAHK